MSLINMDKRFKISKMLFDNYILILLVFCITTHKSCSAFGFDSASSCSPNGKVSRRGRAQMLASIPCDLTHQPYCNLPGAAYPWHAVRRFVHENQGLMKRMYGDVRHISVLRDEIRNNEIDVDDIEMAAERYSRSGPKRASKYMHQPGEDYTIGSDIKKDLLSQKQTTTISTMTTFDESSNEAAEITTLSNKLENVKEDVTQLNKNPLDNKNKKVETKENVKSTYEINNKLSENSTINKIENETQYTNDDNNLASNSVYELPTLIDNEFITPPNDGDNIEIIESPKLKIKLKTINEQFSTTPTTLKTTTITTSTKTTTTTNKPTTNSTTTLETRANTTVTTKRSTTISYIDSYRRRPQYTNRYRPIQLQQKVQQQQLYRINTTIFTTKESLLATNSKQKVNKSESNSIKNPTIPTSNLTSTTAKISPPTTTVSTQTTKSPNGGSLSFISATLKTNTQNLDNQAIRNNTTIEKTPIMKTPETTTHTTTAAFPFVRPKIEFPSGDKLRRQPTTIANKPITAPTPSSSQPTDKPPVLRDGQLFQDTVKQEPAPVANLKGINACPVKEEVVAPFWANNTRGEVLALLNLYPFEQYVHWEKCTHEHKQMYCRDGCRCEQQYRLHRLLAYDPHNECRGIFSDWFRFPSCCICKCYNIPMEFRTTSRSPRMQSFQSDDESKNDSEDHRHPLEIAEEQVKNAIYEHAAEEWYRPHDEYDYYEEN